MASRRQERSGKASCGPALRTMSSATHEAQLPCSNGRLESSQASTCSITLSRSRCSPLESASVSNHQESCKSPTRLNRPPQFNCTEQKSGKQGREELRHSLLSSPLTWVAARIDSCLCLTAAGASNRQFCRCRRHKHDRLFLSCVSDDQ